MMKHEGARSHFSHFLKPREMFGRRLFHLTVFCTLGVLLVVVYRVLNFISVPLNTSTINTTKTIIPFWLNHTHNITCPAKYYGYCMNDGICFLGLDCDGLACICANLYGSMRCEKYLWYH